MRQALAKADLRWLCRARRRGQGAWQDARGIGFASYIECTAWGEGEDGSVDARRGRHRSRVLIGTQSNGQGHETAYAQVVAEHFDVPPERIASCKAIPTRIATGGGTGGSRSIPVGAVMLRSRRRAARREAQGTRRRRLEAAASDLEIADGGVRVIGTDRGLDFRRDRRAAGRRSRNGVMASAEFTPPVPTYPNGTPCLRSRDRSRDRRDGDLRLYDLR